MMDGETGGGLIAAKAERSKRGSYRVSARLQRALLLLASGEAASIKDAAAAVGMTREAISKALKKVSVQTFMREQIMASLNISAMKAAKRMDELLHSPNEMVGFQASRFALAVGADIQPPARPSTTVNVLGGGLLIDLRADGERAAPASDADLRLLGPAGGTLMGATRPAPRLIEAEVLPAISKAEHGPE